VAGCSSFRRSIPPVPAAVLSRLRPWVAWRLFCSVRGLLRTDEAQLLTR
jgi:hypothetical protein